MSRIRIIPPNEAEGRLKEIYLHIEQQRGQIAEVFKIQSLKPESLKRHMDLYVEIMFANSELSRPQREMMAVVVSVANNCSYCIAHHCNALGKYWKSDKRIKHFKKDYREVELSKYDLALCHFAGEITLRPQNLAEIDPTAVLRDTGFSDAAILDATLVISYFNFVNRLVMALGVQLEEDEGKDYSY